MLKQPNERYPEDRLEAAAFRRLCVETTARLDIFGCLDAAAFRRLCVETSSAKGLSMLDIWQPPSGGCVLKLDELNKHSGFYDAAAFRRLCVETYYRKSQAFRRSQPPSGGCVLKHVTKTTHRPYTISSRLQAAVC